MCRSASLLIVGLLYCLFNSLLECVLTLSGIPFAIAGGVLALYVSGLNFSISAAIGFVSLFGVSVMNGILLITYYNQARLHGWTPMDAMLHAGLDPDAAAADDQPLRVHRPASRRRFPPASEARCSVRWPP